MFLGNNNGGGGGGGGGGSGSGGCGGGNRPNHNFGGQDFLVGWSWISYFFVGGSWRIFSTRSLSSFSSILNLICIIFIILISTRSRGGSDATRSHKAAAPASVEQTECGSKMSYGWCHRFQRFHKDDVTDFKDLNDVPWMMSQFSNMLQMRQERCHRFQRCQIDLSQISKFKDVSRMIWKMLHWWCYRIHRDVTDDKRIILQRCLNSKIVYSCSCAKAVKSWPAPFMRLERGNELFTLCTVFQNFISGNLYERISRLCDQLKVSRKIFKDERNTSGNSATFPHLRIWMLT